MTRFDIDESDRPSPRSASFASALERTFAPARGLAPPQSMGPAYVWVGSSCELIRIPREGDVGFQEKMERVAAALRPKEGTSK